MTINQAVLDALSKEDLVLARDELYKSILEEVGTSRSWNNPHYRHEYRAGQETLDVKFDPKRFTYFGLENLQDRYLLRDADGRVCETPTDFYGRVAIGVARGDVVLAQRLCDYMTKLWFLPATPTLMNSATKRGMTVSCFLNQVPDTLSGICDIERENSYLSKYGGGIGTDWSLLRAQDAPLESCGLKSSGIVPFLKVFESKTMAISRNSIRRGAAAAYLRVDHPQIEDFVEIRLPKGDLDRKCQNINHGVTITDAFMEAVRDKKKFKLVDPHYKTVIKEVDAVELWRKILTTRVESGQPYLFFVDAANRARPQHHIDAGLEIHQSNLCCLSSRTEVLTRDAAGNHVARRIVELINESVTIWDGKEWVETSSFNLQGHDKLTRLTFSDGSVVECNAKHRWFVWNNKSSSFSTQHLQERFTSELEVGDDFECTQFEHTTITLTKIEHLEGQYPVFCPTIPSTGKFALANGLMTGNSEITLPTNEERTAVCCLGSINLEQWDEYSQDEATFRQLILDCVTALDNNLETFIEDAAQYPEFGKARFSAMSERSIGLGVMGYHGLLMSRGIPFESIQARLLNRTIFKKVGTAAREASRELASLRGPPPDGGTQRNSFVTSIQPTASTAFLCGQASPSVEPISGNAYMQKTLSGSFLVKNRYLEALLELKGHNTPEVWREITVVRKGSIQHLACLTEEEKAVFRTAFEMNQRELVEQAGDRQPFVDQAQSLNLFFTTPVSGRYLDIVHTLAWERGLKSLYYLRGEAPISAGNSEEIGVSVPKRDFVNEECAVCQ